MPRTCLTASPSLSSIAGVSRAAIAGTPHHATNTSDAVAATLQLPRLQHVRCGVVAQ